MTEARRERRQEPRLPLRRVRKSYEQVADQLRELIVTGELPQGGRLPTETELARSLGVAEQVVFTGYLRGDKLLAALSSFDIGIIPDPVNEYNDKISMNKVFEYSALGIPSVSYDLSETRRLLGDAGSFAGDATPRGLAAAVLPLIDDEQHRRAMGARAGKLAEEKFNWSTEAEKYVAAYADLVRARAYA